jgi:hypothetical protein
MVGKESLANVSVFWWLKNESGGNGEPGERKWFLTVGKWRERGKWRKGRALFKALRPDMWFACLTRRGGESSVPEAPSN